MKYRTIGVNLNRDYRNDLNWNFQQIEDDINGIDNEGLRNELLSDLDELRTELNEKIDLLAGESLDALLQSIEDAKSAAYTAASEANLKGDYADDKGDYADEKGQYAETQGNYAKQKGEYADDKAQLADQMAGLAQQEASNLDAMKINVIDATQNAINAAYDARELKPVGEYDENTEYKRNNMVRYEGSIYLALEDVEGIAPTDDDYWNKIAEKGDKGDVGPKGEQGERGEKGDTGAGVTIIGTLEDENELPATGELGDGYLIDGNLYVWTGDNWENVGNIQGPKGDKGERGEKGEKGDTGDRGPKGDKGDTGPKGDTGLQGPKGDDGASDWGDITNKPDLVNQSDFNTLESDYASHKADITTEEGRHGIRFWQDKFEIKNNGVWEEVSGDADLEVEDWIDATLEAGVENIPGDKLKYYKDPFNVVHVYGVVENKSINTNRQDITILPVGYRPTATCQLIGIVGNGPSSSSLYRDVREITVLSSGLLRMRMDAHDGEYTYGLINVSFRVDD